MRYQIVVKRSAEKELDALPALARERNPDEPETNNLIHEEHEGTRSEQFLLRDLRGLRG